MNRCLFLERRVIRNFQLGRQLNLTLLLSLQLMQEWHRDPSSYKCTAQRGTRIRTAYFVDPVQSSLEVFFLSFKFIIENNFILKHIRKQIWIIYNIMT